MVELDLDEPRDLSQVSVTMGPAIGPVVTTLALTTDQGTVEVAAPAPGQAATFDITFGASQRLRITALDVAGSTRGVQLALAEVQLPAVTPTRVLQVASPGLDVAPDRIDLAVDPRTPACAIVDDTYTCDDVWVRGAQDGQSLTRFVTLPEGAAYQPVLEVSTITGTASARLLARQLLLRATGSPGVSRDLLASPLAAVDADPATTWVASLTAAHPRLRLSWDQPVDVDAVQLALSPGAAAAQPTAVLIRAGNQRRVVDLSEGGLGTFRSLTTKSLVIRIDDTGPAFSVEAGEVVPLPAGVSSVSFPGSDVPVLSPRTVVELGCGTGPTITVNGRDVRTRLSTSLHDVMQAPSLLAEPCSSTDLGLATGANLIAVTPSVLARPDSLVLVRDDGTALEPTPVQTTIEAWGSNARAVALAERAEATLLVVNENFNAGWEATAGGAPLSPVRVDGWKQGWLVPAGAAVGISLVYGPDSTYRLGLWLGALAAGLVIAGAAIRSRRRPKPRLLGSAPMPLVDSLVLLGCLGLIGGWWALGLGVVVLAVRWSTSSSAGTDIGAVGGLLVLAGAVSQAAGRSPTEVSSSGWAQVLIVAALAVGALPVLEKRPTFLRRRNGRSTA